MNKEQLYEEDNKISYVFFFNLLNCIVFSLSGIFLKLMKLQISFHF